MIRVWEYEPIGATADRIAQVVSTLSSGRKTLIWLVNLTLFGTVGY
jgi:hypothetical protein